MDRSDNPAVDGPGGPSGPWPRAIATLAFAALCAGCGAAAVRLPVIPVGFQLGLALFGGVLLGARAGALAQVLVLCAGAVGLPVLGGFTGSEVFHGASAGYFAGLPVAAMAAGLLVERPGALRVVRPVAMGMGSAGLVLGLWLAWGFMPLWLIVTAVLVVTVLAYMRMPSIRTRFWGLLGPGMLAYALGLPWAWTVYSGGGLAGLRGSEGFWLYAVGLPFPVDALMVLIAARLSVDVERFGILTRIARGAPDGS